MAQAVTIAANVNGFDTLTGPTSIGPTPYRFVRASGQAVLSLAGYVRSRHMCPTGTGSEVIRSRTSKQPIRYSTTYGSTRSTSRVSVQGRESAVTPSSPTVKR